MGEQILERLFHLRKKQADVIKELIKRGYKTTAPEFSRMLNGITATKKTEIILNAAEDIIDQWEKERQGK
ncbi:MAG: hypothetical protein E7480_06980 [Ruminococcaceae bacterium]|nr:hypothetical protein [Oscillospiraceae bacterium]